MSLSGSDHSRSQSRPETPSPCEQKGGLEDIKRTCIRNVGWSHDSSNLFHGLKIRTEATMHGENLLIDDSGNWKTVETICKRLPKLDVVTSFAYMRLSQRVTKSEHDRSEHSS